MAPISKFFSNTFSQVQNFFCPPAQNKGPLKQAPWDTLSAELRLMILQYVGEPGRTSLINHEWRALSSSNSMYISLLQRYAVYPRINGFAMLPSSLLDPVTKARCLARAVMRCVAADQILALRQQSDPLSPVFLEQMIQLRNDKLKRQAWQEFCKAVGQPDSLQTLCGESPDANLIYYYEAYFEKERGLYADLLTLSFADSGVAYLPMQIRHCQKLVSLDLSGCCLKNLPHEMKLLAALTTLSLAGNPLPPDHVKDICKALPSLQTVTLYNTDQELLAMFEKEFPLLALNVTECMILNFQCLLEEDEEAFLHP